MGEAELLVIALGLSMDAFAAAVCKGLAAGRATPGQMLTVGAYFGGFQALMPLMGAALARGAAPAMARADHWIAFGLLTLIGLGMLRSAAQEDAGGMSASLSPGAMLPLAVATSIDALATGVTLAVLGTPVRAAAAVIGGTTFAASAAGLKLGSVCGAANRRRAEWFGGAVLVLMGVRILLRHLWG